MRCKFQPRAYISARSFLLVRAIWFLAFVANSTSGITKPKLPVTSAALRRPHQSLAGGRAGRRIYAGFGATCAFQSRPTCFHAATVHIEGEYVFLFRREQYHRTTGFRPAIADATCCCCGGHASPVGRKDGTPNPRISVRFRFSPDRTQRSLLLSVRIHHVLALVVKALSNLWCRLDQVFSTSPFRATTPAPGCWWSGTPNAIAGTYPAGVFVPW